MRLAYDGLTFEVETEARGVEVRSAGALRVFTSAAEWAETFGKEKTRGDLTQSSQRKRAEDAEKSGPTSAAKSAASADRRGPAASPIYR